ncbi:hypothetical protein chiPu_0015883 [Chiloscyllium punctatum]|uniref:Uncharacterized protein n=1 Tax=Chiloscyllium punctatum TaxID=137246 RepID=A0A401T401_CHIPU|nr:hypothetical protein [Chiloscyllium punctatum]
MYMLGGRSAIEEVYMVLGGRSAIEEVHMVLGGRSAIEEVYMVLGGRSAIEEVYMVGRGADLSALVREASINALRQHLSGQSSEQASAPSSGIRVARHHFEAAFEKVKPSVSKKDQLMYEMLRQSLSQSL